MTQRAALIAKVKLQGDPNDPNVASPIVTLEDYFEGNNDLGSIGCNLGEHPGIGRFYQVLKGVRAKPEVQAVLVAVKEIVEEAGFEDWPHSDTVYVISSQPKIVVQQWVSDLQPTEIGEGWFLGRQPASAPALKPGMKVYFLWWD